MDKTVFIEKFKDVLQTDNELSFEDYLEDIEEWDSLSKMATIAFIDKEFGQKITFEQINKLETVGDIAKIVGI